MTFKHFALLASFVAPNFNSACQEQLRARSDASPRQGKPGVRITATVKNVAELPVCDAGSQGLAGYISPEDNFVKCHAGRWRTVTPGATAFNYSSRSPIRFYEWEDSVAKKRWFIPLENEIAANEIDSKGCSKGWKLPSKDELLAASMNGLLEGIKSHGGRSFDNAWTADFANIDGVSQRVSINLANAVQKEQGKTSAAGLYCVSLAGD